MRHSIIAISACLVMLLGASPKGTAAQVKKVVPVWEALQEGHEQYYRIPAVAKFPDGTLVALCDRGDISGNIKVKRSFDNGNTWSSEIRLASGMSANHGDAALAYDTKTKRMVCLFNADKSFNSRDCGQIWMTTSTDGVNWTEPVEKTSQFQGQAKWINGFVASGNMLCTKDGALMVVANGCMKYNRNWLPPYDPPYYPDHEETYEYVFKSTDGGVNWTLVSPAGSNGKNGPVSGYGNEAKLVELPNGNLLCSVRSNTYDSTKKYHRFSRSTDGGKTWTQISEGAIDECKASSGSNSDIISLDYNGQNYLVLAVASNTSDSDYRRDINVYYSTDQGRSWNSRMLFKGYAGYASLVKLDEASGTIGALVEIGQSGYYFSQNFFTFNMEWLLGTGDHSFDGTLDCDGDRYMKIPYSAAFGVPANGAITITANIFLRSYGRPQGIVATRESLKVKVKDYLIWKEKDEFRGYELHGGWGLEECFSNNVNLDGHLKSTLNHKYENTANSVVAGRWAHIAWTFNSKTGESCLYVDGELKEKSVQDNDGKSAKGAGMTLVENFDVLVGARYHNKKVDNDYIWDGKIDDLRFYREALDAADIERDKESGFPLEDKTLIAAYDFQDINGTQVTDISGNGHTGTLVGTFPEAPKDFKTWKVEPEVGTLTLERFDDGHALGVGTGGFMNSKNADYRASFAMTDNEANFYDFIGIQVNGHAIDPDGFFKAGEDSEVTVLVRKKSEPFTFQLVDEDGTVRDFVPGNDFTHHLYIDGEFTGNFHIIEKVANVRAASEPLRLFGHPDQETLEGHGFVNVRPGVVYNVYNVPASSEETPMYFTTHHYDVNTGQIVPGVSTTFHNPEFTLTYGPAAKTLTVSFDSTGGMTGIGNVNGDADSVDPDAPVEFYNLQGVRVPADRLTPGIYIRRQGNKASKVAVR